MEPPASIDFTGYLPIFPLPNCVLLPRAILPLHIFEPRYREMVADALKGPALITMAVLEPGYEEKYYTHCARIRPVVCVGRIVRNEMLDDGRYNILLQGLVRASVQREDRQRSYRRGILKPIPTLCDVSDEKCAQIRRRLARLFDAPPLAELARHSQWLSLIENQSLPFSDVVDFLACSMGGSVDCCVRFLEEPHLSRRIEMLTEKIKELACHLAAHAAHAVRPAAPPRRWPRSTICN